jgi:hypothetical protein
VIQEEGLYVYNMHYTAKKKLSISIAPARSRGGSLVSNKLGSLSASTHTYHSHYICKGIAEAFQEFHRDTQILPKRLSYEEYCGRDRW